MKNGLVDEIGGEKEALAWLEKNKKISSKLEVQDVKTSEPEKSLKDMLFGDSKETKMMLDQTRQPDCWQSGGHNLNYSEIKK